MYLNYLNINYLCVLLQLISKLSNLIKMTNESNIKKNEQPNEDIKLLPTVIEDKENNTTVNTRHNSRLKYVVLVLCCLSLTGDYYCFDNPGALHSSLKKQFSHIKGEEFEYMFTLMYSIYSIPNMILPIIGGIMIVKFGNKTMYLVFSSLVMIGQCIFAFGVSKGNPLLTLIGRFIFGLGGESLNTTQSTMIMQWFTTNQISLVLGIFLSIARLASVCNDVISPRIATYTEVSSSLWLGFLLTIISFISTVLLIYLDHRQDIKQNEVNLNKETTENTNEPEKFSFSRLFSFNKVS